MKDIVLKFKVENEISDVKPLGEGLINDTFKVYIKGEESPKYVLQRINNAIFQDVELLQDNIEKVTNHIRKKLEASNVVDGGSFDCSGDLCWDGALQHCSDPGCAATDSDRRICSQQQRIK